MNHKRIGTIGAVALAGAVMVLAVTPLGGAAIHRVSALIAPTSKSAVADINAFALWDPSTYSRDGFSKVTHPGATGMYCLSGRANPDKSMLKTQVDYQHSIVHGGTVEWNRASPNCGPGLYEVWTFCPSLVFFPVDAPTPQLDQFPSNPPCDEVAFYAEAYVR
jgi:hypothetical protein